MRAIGTIMQYWNEIDKTKVTQMKIINKRIKDNKIHIYLNIYIFLVPTFKSNNVYVYLNFKSLTIGRYTIKIAKTVCSFINIY